MEESFLAKCVEGISKDDLESKLGLEQQEFVSLTNSLLKQKKIQIKQIDGQMIITALNLNKNKLNLDEDAVLKAIKVTAKNGLWHKHIRPKTQLHPSKIEKILKKLIDLKLIQTFKNIEYPSRLYYISAGFKPLESATGGPWFTDMELDTAFVEGLTDHIFKYLQIKTKSHLTYTITSYAIILPSIDMIQNHVAHSGITSVDLSIADVRKLIRLLEYDGKVESVFSDGLERFLVHSRYNGPKFNAPCSNCPVAEQCIPDGKINPLNCEYLDKWLSF